MGRRGHGLEAVGLVAVKVYEAAPAAVGQHASAAVDHVRVDVDRIARVGHRHDAVARIYVAEIAEVALGAVGDEDLVGGDVDAARGIVVGGHGLAQEGVALLRPVAVER